MEPVIRKSSPYNTFMKLNLDAFKNANPSLDHKEAFVGLARVWMQISTPDMTADTVPQLTF